MGFAKGSQDTTNINHNDEHKYEYYFTLFPYAFYINIRASFKKPSHYLNVTR